MDDITSVPEDSRLKGNTVDSSFSRTLNPTARTRVYDRKTLKQDLNCEEPVFPVFNAARVPRKAGTSSVIAGASWVTERNPQTNGGSVVSVAKRLATQENEKNKAESDRSTDESDFGTSSAKQVKQKRKAISRVATVRSKRPPSAPNAKRKPKARSPRLLADEGVGGTSGSSTTEKPPQRGSTFKQRHVKPKKKRVVSRQKGAHAMDSAESDSFDEEVWTIKTSTPNQKSSRKRSKTSARGPKYRCIETSYSEDKFESSVDDLVSPDCRRSASNVVGFSQKLTGCADKVSTTRD